MRHTENNKYYVFLMVFNNKKSNNNVTFPYPEFNIFKPKFSFSYKRERLNVDFVELDKETRKQLKEAILNVVEKRRQEIVEELKQL